MTLDRLTFLLDAYGADPARWPVADRDAARALIEASPDAHVALAQARAIDRALGLPEAPAVSPALRARVLADAERWMPKPQHARARHAGWRDWLNQTWPGPVWQPATAFAFSIALGGVFGLWGLEATIESANEDLIALMGDDAIPAIDLDAFDPAGEG